MFIDTRERPAGEVQQKVGRLKLSEAIRIGARIRPQCAGLAFDNGRSCALGAAYEGYFGKTLFESPFNFPWTAMSEIFDIPISFLAKIADRNDSGESRESIATWLEQQGL